MAKGSNKGFSSGPKAKPAPKNQGGSTKRPTNPGVRPTKKPGSSGFGY